MKKSSRQFGISVNYKIPTTNKLAREEKSNLTPDKSGKDKGGLYEISNLKKLKPHLDLLSGVLFLTKNSYCQITQSCC